MPLQTYIARLFITAWFGLSLLKGSMLLAGATIQPSTKTPAPTQVYRHVMDGAPRSLDPLLAGTRYAKNILTSVYDTLYEFKYLKQPYELKPNLAARMPDISPDRLVIKIPIKKGVFFVDDPCFVGGKGREVTAEDFVFSIKRHFDPKNMSSGRWQWQNRIRGLEEWAARGANYSDKIEGLMAVDRYTILIKLNKPFPQMTYTLADPHSSILPYEADQYYGKQLATKTVGSGPWVLKSFNSKLAVLEKNPKYRKEIFDLNDQGYQERDHAWTNVNKLQGRTLPIVDRIEVNFMEQPGPRWTSFTKGTELHYSWIPSMMAEQVLGNRKPIALKPEYASKYKLRAQQELGFIYFEFNMDHPAFGYHPDPIQNGKNKALRCAVRKAYDWPQLIHKTLYGIGEAFAGVLPTNIEGFDQTLPRDSVIRDIPGAKKLLKDAGWNETNLPVLTYSGVNTIQMRRNFDLFSSWMQQIGFPKSKLKFETFATFGDYFKAIKERKLQTHQMSWSLDYPDGENVFQIYYGPNEAPGPNTANYKNQEYDKVYEKFAALEPGPARTELFRKANEILIEDCVVISGFSRTHLHMWHKNVILYPDQDVIGNFYKYVAFEDNLP